ncbi:hypothetical protein GGR58DRAFT_507368 [Xylaria digitata]|nr:hypothetical protein GGR58DRAFT_507368 [Xylaria digitata]
MAAGADIVAVTLRAIFFLCLQRPAAWTRFQGEMLRAPFAQRDIMDLPVSLAQARALPYLAAMGQDDKAFRPKQWLRDEAGGETE